MSTKNLNDCTATLSQYFYSQVLLSPSKPKNTEYISPWRRITEFELEFYYTDRHVYDIPYRRQTLTAVYITGALNCLHFSAFDVL
jgi:hypothetical protein